MGEPPRRQRPTRRPGEQQPRRLLGGQAQGADTAIGLHKEDQRGEAALAQALLQPVQIGLHHRHQHRVQHGGGTPLILADLRADVAGERDRQIRPRLRDHRAHRPLMCGIGKAVDQRDSDTLRPDGGDAREAIRHTRGIQRRLHRTIRAHPLHHAEARIAWHQHRVRIGREAVDVPAHMAVDLQHILEARGRDQCGARKLALQHRIGRNGRAMQQQPNLGEREAEALTGFGDAAQQPHRGIIRRRGRLPRMHRARAAVENLKVGESAADIDSDADWFLGAHCITFGSHVAICGQIINNPTASR